MDPTRHHRIINYIINSAIIFACLIVLAISLIIKAQTEHQPTVSESTPEPIIVTPYQPSDENTPPPPTEDPDPNEVISNSFINLQPVVDTWIKSLGPNETAGVMIYDITNSRTAASFNANQTFSVASIYKLLFAYDGYRQIANGLENPNTIITTTEDKGTLTLSQCLDLIIRESYNGCADVMNHSPQRIARVNELMREFKMDHTSNIGLQSTATDITKILLRFWYHTDLNDLLWSQISDSMLNQPPSRSTNGKVYDWRQGLPAGFSDQVKVYNKVGWDWNGETWNIYADAAILEFTDLQHIYTAVVLTKNLSNYTKITQLGRMIEAAVENGES